MEGQNYVFSYPKNYVKRADELGENEILLFASSNKPLIPKNSDFQTIHLSSNNITTEIVIVKRIDKMLWNPKNKSVTYDAIADYNIATSQDQADALNAAVDAFTLK